MVQEKVFSLVLPVPINIDPTIFASLTKGRQKILINLLKSGELTFTNLLDISKLQASSLSETLKAMEEKGLVCKNNNKNYCLSRDGKLLGLMLMQPNGVKMEEIRETLSNLLKTEFGITDPSTRKDLVEDLKQKGDFIVLEEKENA